MNASIVLFQKQVINLRENNLIPGARIEPVLV
jgi:hypothetical protein